jgi:trehalose/maltose hydrolase-like predicted phosphorylase
LTIKDVLPPDEDAQPNQNNTVYTNIIASLAISYANYTTCLANTPPLDNESLKKARCLHIPFDNTRGIHLEYEGYTNEQIKQADVVLIGFPLMWPMDPQVRRNDLLYYENKTRANGPAMTWG